MGHGTSVQIFGQPLLQHSLRFRPRLFGPRIHVPGATIPQNAGIELVDIGRTISGAQSIGFAIPINKARRDLAEVKTYGRIRRPFFGIRYVLLNPLLQKKFKLAVDHGAFVLREGHPGAVAVLPGSAADKAGIKESDIILELNQTPISEKLGIEDVLEKLSLGEVISAKVLRDGEEKTFRVTAEERI